MSTQEKIDVPTLREVNSIIDSHLKRASEYYNVASNSIQQNIDACLNEARRIISLYDGGTYHPKKSAFSGVREFRVGTREVALYWCPDDNEVSVITVVYG